MRTLGERVADLLHCLREVAEHQLRRQPQHAIARALQTLVPARPERWRRTSLLVTAVDLDDELLSRSHKVNDAGADHHLAAEPNASLLPESSAQSRRSEVVGACRMLRASPSRRATWRDELGGRAFIRLLLAASDRRSPPAQTLCRAQPSAVVSVGTAPARRSVCALSRVGRSL
jgi:hypothetical protein